jgi:hypothetical protein
LKYKACFYILEFILLTKEGKIFLNYIFLTGAIFIFILIAHFQVNAIVANSQDKVVIIPFQNLG